jgi:hypothetical protein
MNTPWDPLHRAYFNGEALWTYPPNVEIGRVETHAQRKSRPFIVARHARPKRLRNRCEDHLGSRRDRQVAALA